MSDVKEKAIASAKLRAQIIAYFNNNPEARVTLRDVRELFKLHLEEHPMTDGALYQHLRLMVNNEQISRYRKNKNTPVTFFKYTTPVAPPLPKPEKRELVMPAVARMPVQAVELNINGSAITLTGNIAVSVDLDVSGHFHVNLTPKVA